MFRSVLGLTAVAVGLAICGSAQASKRGGHRHHHGHSHIHGHNQGHHLKIDFFYEGKHHKHWSHSQFNRHYKTTFYFDPGHRLWFYWSARRGAFLPISYIDSDPPINDLGPNPGEDDEDD